MTINIPGTGSHKPVDNNRPNTDNKVKKTTKTNKVEGVRYFTATDGESKIDRRRAPQRRSMHPDRRLLKTKARDDTDSRRQGPRERRRSTSIKPKRGYIGKNIGNGIDREV